MTSDRIQIHCDGACAGNGRRRNRGGWAAILVHKGRTRTVSGGEPDTTNQRMELTACIKGLESVKDGRAGIDVYSDSAYLVNCFRDRWHERWVRNGWKNYRKQPVENRDLWERLLKLVARYDVSFHKVSGHSGNVLNEAADRLARAAMKEARPGA
ncbi:MAG: ribonuclease HI [Dehalococcoidia bacterium]|nr:ribonuclease HI [Dehalococcoidia bacterium]